MSKELNNYFMKPTYLNDLPIYPIKLMDYEEFKSLASLYIILDMPQLNNKLKQENQKALPFESLFNYLTEMIKEEHRVIEYLKKEIKDEDIEKSRLQFNLNKEQQICRLFEITLKKKVIFNKLVNCFAILGKDNELLGVLSEENFYEWRNIVMNQNLLFTPLIAPSKQAQKYIDAKINCNSNSEMDMEAIIAFVSTNTNKDYYDCTYYRLIADFKSLIKQLNRTDTVRFISGGMTKQGGGQLDIPSVCESLGMNDNPYDNVFTVNKENK